MIIVFLQVFTLYYLDILVKSLMKLCLHPLVLPVLNLELIIALVTLTNNSALCKLIHMRYSYTVLLCSTVPI